MSAELRAERQGDCLVLRLHHPETRHALSAALCAAALEALTTAQRDPDIRAVVLTGSTPHFCSGLHDLDALEALHDCILALRDCEPLVVGAIEGQARGAGAALALIESLSAKLRLFRAPEYLAIAFLMAVLGLLVHLLLGAGTHA